MKEELSLIINTDTMLVTVIIPTYNAEKTIARCLDSVLQQTYSEIEIICGDDCSTDKTIDILEEYSQKYASITFFQNSINSKAAFTRNECIKRSKGVFIAQIDDDDYMDPTRIEKQVDYLSDHPEIDFVGSEMYYFDENGIWSKSKVIVAPQKNDFLFTSMFSNPSVTFRRDCLEAIGGYRVAKETARGQDYDLFMRLYSAGYIGENIKIPLTYYYRGEKGYKKTNIKTRYHEFLVRWKNFKSLGLMPIGALFALKPLVLAIIPFELLEKIKKKNNRNMRETDV